MIEQDLQSYLATQTGEKVYPLHLPQNPDNPAVVYERQGGQFGYTTDGPGTFKESHFQVSAMASKYSEAKTLIASIVTALDGYSGVISGTNIFLIKIVSGPIDVYEYESEKYRSTIFIEIQHEA